VKLSCLPVSFFKEIRSDQLSLGQWARMAADLGADGIDISPVLLKSLDFAHLEKVRKDVEASGIGLIQITGYTDFTHPDPRKREREVEKLGELVFAASVLGARYIRVTAGQAHPETSREEGIEWAIEGLDSSLRAAQEYGIRLVYENHSKPSVWERPDFSFPTDIFLTIAQATEGTDLGILFDTANTLAYGDDPLDALGPVVHRVEYVHAADIEQKGTLKHVVVGTGIVPFKEIFAALKKVDFDGWISVEEASRTGETGVREAIEFVRRTWEEV
jgi:sugar phosphate isomerase/epimerase